MIPSSSSVSGSCSPRTNQAATQAGSSGGASSSSTDSAPGNSSLSGNLVGLGQAGIFAFPLDPRVAFSGVPENALINRLRNLEPHSYNRIDRLALLEVAENRIMESLEGLQEISAEATKNGEAEAATKNDHSDLILAYKNKDHWAKTTIIDMAMHRIMAESMIRFVNLAQPGLLQSDIQDQNSLVDEIKKFQHDTFTNLAFTANKFARGAHKYRKNQQSVEKYCQRNVELTRGNKYYQLNMANSQIFASDLKSLLKRLTLKTAPTLGHTPRSEAQPESWTQAAFRILMDHYLVPEIAVRKNCSEHDARSRYIDHQQENKSYFWQREKSWNIWPERFQSYSIWMQAAFDIVRPEEGGAPASSSKNKDPNVAGRVDANHTYLTVDGSVLMRPSANSKNGESRDAGDPLMQQPRPVAVSNRRRVAAVEIDPELSPNDAVRTASHQSFKRKRLSPMQSAQRGSEPKASSEEESSKSFGGKVTRLAPAAVANFRVDPRKLMTVKAEVHAPQGDSSPSDGEEPLFGTFSGALNTQKAPAPSTETTVDAQRNAGALISEIPVVADPEGSGTIRDAAGDLPAPQHDADHASVPSKPKASLLRTSRWPGDENNDPASVGYLTASIPLRFDLKHSNGSQWPNAAEANAELSRAEVTS